MLVLAVEGENRQHPPRQGGTMTDPVEGMRKFVEFVRTLKGDEKSEAQLLGFPYIRGRS
jgi:hypothetical protein